MRFHQEWAERAEALAPEQRMKDWEQMLETDNLQKLAKALTTEPKEEQELMELMTDVVEDLAYFQMMHRMYQGALAQEAQEENNQEYDSQDYEDEAQIWEKELMPALTRAMKENRLENYLIRSVQNLWYLEPVELVEKYLQSIKEWRDKLIEDKREEIEWEIQDLQNEIKEELSLSPEEQDQKRLKNLQMELKMKQTEDPQDDYDETQTEMENLIEALEAWLKGKTDWESVNYLLENEYPPVWGGLFRWRYPQEQYDLEEIFRRTRHGARWSRVYFNQVYNEDWEIAKQWYSGTIREYLDRFSKNWEAETRELVAQARTETANELKWNPVYVVSQIRNLQSTNPSYLKELKEEDSLMDWIISYQREAELQEKILVEQNLKEGHSQESAQAHAENVVREMVRANMI